MVDRSGLETRLTMIVNAVDAGKYQSPSNAVDAILGVLASHYQPHRDELIVWLVGEGVLSERGLMRCPHVGECECNPKVVRIFGVEPVPPR